MRDFILRIADLPIGFSTNLFFLQFREGDFFFVFLVDAVQFISQSVSLVSQFAGLSGQLFLLILDRTQRLIELIGQFVNGALAGGLLRFDFLVESFNLFV